jgi:tetratricopeptide (TPR) repeat protein
MAKNPPTFIRPSRRTLVDRQPAGWQSGGPAADLATLSALEAKLERARSEYNADHFDSAAQILSALEPVFASESTNLNSSLYSRYSLLKGSFYCLRGRSLTKGGNPHDAQVMFALAADIFRPFRSEIDKQKSPTRIKTDYGIALFRTHQLEECIEILTQICDAADPAPLEAFGYLALAFQEKGMLKEAEETFRKGLRLLPNDAVLTKGLAETLERMGKKSEAVSAYCDAALAVWPSDSEGAFRLAKRALDISPTDTEALSVAVALKRSERDLNGAMVIVERVLEADPKNSWALGLRGMLLYDLGEFGEAARTLAAIAVDGPQNAWILQEFARSLHELGGPENDTQALAALDRSLKLNARQTEALAIRAQIEIDRGNREAAIAAIDEAIQTDPNSAQLLCELGKILLKAGEPVRAERQFDRALLLDPKSASALSGKAMVVRAQGRTDEALGLVRRALNLQPESTSTLASLVELLLEEDRIEDALDELDAEIERRPTCAAAHSLRADVLIRQGKLEEAATAYERASTLEPSNTEYHIDLADAFCRLGAYDKAGPEYNTALQLEGDSAQIIGRNAFYLSEIAAFPEASILIAKAVPKEPENSWYLGLQGWCFQHMGGRFAYQASSAYKEALDREPSAIWWKKGLANTLCLLGREEEALRKFEEIIQAQKYLKDDDGAVSSTLGWCYYRLRRYDEAARLLRAGLSKVYDPIALEFDLGLILLASSRLDLAARQYDRADRLCQKKNKLKQRGLYYVAIFDLVEAVEEQRIEVQYGGILQVLQYRLVQSGIESANSPSLGEWINGGRIRESATRQSNT